MWTCHGKLADLIQSCFASVEEKTAMKTLIIDNYDSFTFNLYQIVAEINGEYPLVFRNDELDWDTLLRLEFDNVIISPGPGRPEKEEDFGICRRVLQFIERPLLGVCLGHQGIGHFFGGEVTHAPEVRHGRLSKIYHNGSDIFENIPQGISVVRYHSLIVLADLPKCLEKTAWTDDGLVMGLRHKQKPLWGVQFHPESICTEYGKALLQNFRDITYSKVNNGSVSHNGSGRKGGRLSLLEAQVCAVPRESAQRTKTEISKQEFEIHVRKLSIFPPEERVFVHLFGSEPIAFWLDSSLVEASLSRFSFMGSNTGPNSRLVQYHMNNQELTITRAGKSIQLRQSIFEYLETELGRLRIMSDDLPFDFNCGFVGYFGYELKAECGGSVGHTSPLPDAAFIFADRIIVFDHLEKSTYLLCLTGWGGAAQAQAYFDETEQKLSFMPPLQPVETGHSTEPITFRLGRSYETYMGDIRQCLRELHDGESYEVCLTNKISTRISVDPLALYRTLRQVNPAPHAAYLRFDKFTVLCSSPECFLTISRDGWVESKPIKGTLRRGSTPEEDRFLKERLRQSEKDRAENLMIVDLLRNDLGQVCDVGSVHVTKLMDVETYATVHQLVSTIRGHLREDMNAIVCVRKAFPGGSMTGAPKIRTMKIIDQCEHEARGVYSGSIGYLALSGAADLNIVIRTAVVTSNKISIGMGGAIVALSNPQVEFDEIMLKAKALIQSILLNVQGRADSDNYVIIGGQPQHT